MKGRCFPEPRGRSHSTRSTAHLISLLALATLCLPSQSSAQVTIVTNPPSLTFFIAGGTPGTQQIQVSLSNGAVASATLTPSTGILVNNSNTTISVQLPRIVNINVDPTLIAGNISRGTIRVNVPGAGITAVDVPVIYERTGFGGGVKHFLANTTGLTFTQYQDSTPPAPQQFSLIVTGGSIPNYLISVSYLSGIAQDWLQVSPAPGTLSASSVVTVSAITTRLPAGTYQMGISLVPQTSGFNTVTVPVTLHISGATCVMVMDNMVPVTAPAEGLDLVYKFTEIGGRCTWTATSQVAWVQPFPLKGTGSGQVNFTIFPNFTTLPRTTTLTVVGQTAQITQSGMTGSASLRFVRLAYFSAFRRLPSAADEAFHLERLDSGTSRTALLLSFLRSAEFRAGGAFVTGLYRVLLGRIPEKSGWDFQMNAVVKLNLAQSLLTSAYLTSAEWQLTQGNPVTDQQFVDLLYREILGRPPADAERAFQTGALAAGASRADMATAFLGVPEFYLRNGALLDAIHAYFVVLGRDPSALELTTIESRLRAGTPFEAIIGELLSSSEHIAALL